MHGIFETFNDILCHFIQFKDLCYGIVPLPAGWPRSAPLSRHKEINLRPFVDS